MAKKTIELPNGKVWATQTEAMAHFKAMLHRYADNETVEDWSDHDDLVALLERYDGVISDDPSKIGPGIEHFFRRRNVGTGFSTPGFWVRRIDGSETDFSYPSAVRGEPKSHQQEFYDACRNAVAADLLAAKKSHFQLHGDADARVRCDLTDALITFGEAHLDHAYPTFGQLVVSFRAANGWQQGVPIGILSLPDDAQTTTKFVDLEVADRFRAFHRGAAMVRVVARSQNLAMAARQRRPKIRRPLNQNKSYRISSASDDCRAAQIVQS
jgi:hypothetical protein